ncbi:hypothetical protein ACE3MZ_02470 [Paenibacillus sp. WLX1005]|uniref:hypothetical protein n=1 Tax=unclassified Paenibacillus TaxID=185978 RepID=UPI0039841C83
MKQKPWLTLLLTAVLVGFAALPVGTVAAASTDESPDGSYSMDLNNDDSTSGDVEDDTYSDDGSLDTIDPALEAEANEFVNYADAMDPLLTYEDKAWSAYNKNDYVSAANRKEEYRLMTYTVVPNYTKFVAGLKQVKPQNAKLAAMHAKYVKGAYAELEGFMLYKKYVSSTTLNKTLLKKAEAKLDSGGALIDQFYSELDDYITRFDVLDDSSLDSSTSDDSSSDVSDDFI